MINNKKNNTYISKLVKWFNFYFKLNSPSILGSYTLLVVLNYP